MDEIDENGRRREKEWMNLFVTGMELKLETGRKGIGCNTMDGCNTREKQTE